MTLQRYDIDETRSEIQCEDGYYVRFEDAEAEIKIRDKRISELESSEQEAETASKISASRIAELVARARRAEEPRYPKSYQGWA